MAINAVVAGRNVITIMTLEPFYYMIALKS